MAALVRAFQEAGVDDAAHDARLLLCAAAGIEHSALIRDPEFPLGEEVAEKLAGHAARRMRREPVTRILGTRGFWSLELNVAPDVLDPRPDSESLIDAALQCFSNRQDDPLAIADLGSGSGALLCALLDVFPNARGTAVDISRSACDLTRRNLVSCGMMTRARIVESDWSTSDIGLFDLVISNPPYIMSGDIGALDPEVAFHDPRLALDGGMDGFDAYRSLAVAVPRLLAEDGVAIVELGIGQRERVCEIFSKAGLETTFVQRDLGGVERALVLSKARVSTSNRGA
jgi:release factor glutamine methyltransferase